MDIIPLEPLLTQHIIPLVYDESLSYLEMVMAVRVKVNELIADYNDFDGRLSQFSAWVDTQLNAYSLAAISGLVADGAFTALLVNEIQPTFEAEVAAFIEEIRAATAANAAAAESAAATATESAAVGVAAEADIAATISAAETAIDASVDAAAGSAAAAAASAAGNAAAIVAETDARIAADIAAISTAEDTTTYVVTQHRVAAPLKHISAVGAVGPDGNTAQGIHTDWTTLRYLSKSDDTFNEYSGATGVFTFANGGWFEIDANCTLWTSAGSEGLNARFRILHNGAALRYGGSVAGGALGYHQVSVRALHYFDAGDTVAIQITNSVAVGLSDGISTLYVTSRH